ncbi:hypothetical protein ABTM85_20730, partial [Acinetobacter baumannii]
CPFEQAIGDCLSIVRGEMCLKFGALRLIKGATPLSKKLDSPNYVVIRMWLTPSKAFRVVCCAPLSLWD